jgi:hypothetical protein
MKHNRAASNLYAILVNKYKVNKHAEYRLCQEQGLLLNKLKEGPSQSVFLPDLSGSHPITLPLPGGVLSNNQAFFNPLGD